MSAQIRFRFLRFLWIFSLTYNIIINVRSQMRDLRKSVEVTIYIFNYTLVHQCQDFVLNFTLLLISRSFLCAGGFIPIIPTLTVMPLAGGQCGLQPTRNLGVQLTLLQPGGVDYAHHITDSPPGFEKPAASLDHNFPKI